MSILDTGNLISVIEEVCADGTFKTLPAHTQRRVLEVYEAYYPDGPAKVLRLPGIDKE